MCKHKEEITKSHDGDRKYKTFKITTKSREGQHSILIIILIIVMLPTGQI